MIGKEVTVGPMTRMDSEVIDLHDYHIACTQCGCTSFNLRCDKPGVKWEKILGSECERCGAFVGWEVVR